MALNKEEKYDRQLRLWASDGQQDLEESQVCLVNASSTGCEILKNLVLPNVGGFTIIDGKTVLEDDLSSNFFLSEDDIGHFRAKAAASLLRELNPTVKSSYISSSLNEVLANDTVYGDQFWNKFNLVVVTSTLTVSDSVYKLIDKIWEKVPVLIANSVGFYGSLRVVAAERPIIQTHESEIPDLRIDCPWKELQEYVDSLGIDMLSVEEIKNIPYSVLLIYFKNQYVQQFSKLPARKEFKLFIESHKTIASIRHFGLENIEELLKFSWRGCTKTSIPLQVKKILQHPHTQDFVDNGKPSYFWALVAALKEFVSENNGRLPLSGKVIDMASSTEKYIELQNIYRRKAAQDKAAVEQHLNRILKESGFSRSNVSSALIANFCKNSQYLVVQDGSNTLINETMKNSIINHTPHSKTPIYLALLAVERFCHINLGKFPKSTDLPHLLKISESLLGQLLQETASETHINTLKEIIRSEGTEMVSIAALVGGLGGQEALKLLTNQYIPLNNTLVFDGVQSSIDKWRS